MAAPETGDLHSSPASLASASYQTISTYATAQRRGEWGGGGSPPLDV